MCFAGSEHINSAHDKTRGNTLVKTDRITTQYSHNDQNG